MKYFRRLRPGLRGKEEEEYCATCADPSQCCEEQGKENPCRNCGAYDMTASESMTGQYCWSCKIWSGFKNIPPPEGWKK